MKYTMKIFGVVVAVFAVGFFLAPVQAGPAATYIGSRKCKTCHYKKYRTWRDSHHAKAYDALPDENKTDASCLKCHTVGLGKKSGFVSKEKTPELLGVGCETCHGAGSEHYNAALNEMDDEDKIKNSIVRKMDNVCIQCHNSHSGKGPSRKSKDD